MEKLLLLRSSKFNSDRENDCFMFVSTIMAISKTVGEDPFLAAKV